MPGDSFEHSTSWSEIVKMDGFVPRMHRGRRAEWRCYSFSSRPASISLSRTLWKATWRLAPRVENKHRHSKNRDRQKPNSSPGIAHEDSASCYIPWLADPGSQECSGLAASPGLGSSK